MSHNKKVAAKLAAAQKDKAPTSPGGFAKRTFVMPNRPDTPPNFGSLSADNVNADNAYRNLSKEDADMLTPIILRPDIVLGDQRTKGNTIIARHAGYSKAEIEELTDMDRLNVRSLSFSISL